MRNLTTVKYNVQIPAGEKESLSYAFTTDMQPADLRLSLAAVVGDEKGNMFTFQAFNETVAVVEPETSLFDPQMWVSLSFLDLIPSILFSTNFTFSLPYPYLPSLFLC